MTVDRKGLLIALAIGITVGLLALAVAAIGELTVIGIAVAVVLGFGGGYQAYARYVRQQDHDSRTTPPRA